MRTGEAVIIALLIFGLGWCCMRPTGEPFANPYAVLNNRLSAVRGEPNAARYLVPDGAMVAKAERRLKRSLAKASANPEQVHEAERGAWAAARAAPGADNVETYGDAAAEISATYADSPALDYGKYMTSLVADPYTLKNHMAWAAEMAPFSRTTFSPETPSDLDEMQEASLKFIGLRRPQAVAVYNPMMLTEIGPEQLASNKRFNFQG